MLGYSTSNNTVQSVVLKQLILRSISLSCSKALELSLEPIFWTMTVLELFLHIAFVVSV